MPWPVHEVRSLHNRLVNDDHLPNDWGAIHDPAFDHGLNHTMDHRLFHDRLNDFSLYNSALNDRMVNVALDDPTLEGRLIVVILDVNPASGRSIFKGIIVIERVAFAELRGSRN